MHTLATQPESILVSAETVKDYQLHVGDPLTLRLTDAQTHQPRAVSFYYGGWSASSRPHPKTASSSMQPWETLAWPCWAVDQGAACPNLPSLEIRSSSFTVSL